MRTITLALAALLLLPSAGEASLECPPDIGAARGEPILLVHGSGGSARVWDWNWRRLTAQNGLDACAVSIPTYATADIQLTVNAVVRAVRMMAKRSGERVDVVGHSQGGNQIRWAAKFWPVVRRRLDDVVMLGTPNHGTLSGNAMCATGSCAPINWQLRRGSAFIAAANSGDPTPGTVDYTSIYTQFDELDHPANTAVISGAVNVALQEVCPGRYTHHFALIYDAVATELALDALLRDGPARPGVIERSVCRRFAMPGLPPADAIRLDARWYSDGGRRVAEAERIAAEPPLRPYARADAPAGA